MAQQFTFKLALLVIFTKLAAREISIQIINAAQKEDFIGRSELSDYLNYSYVLLKTYCTSYTKIDPDISSVFVQARAYGYIAVRRLLLQQ